MEVVHDTAHPGLPGTQAAMLASQGRRRVATIGIFLLRDVIHPRPQSIRTKLFCTRPAHCHTKSMQQDPGDRTTIAVERLAYGLQISPGLFGCTRR